MNARFLAAMGLIIVVWVPAWGQSTPPPLGGGGALPPGTTPPGAEAPHTGVILPGGGVQPYGNGSRRVEVIVNADLYATGRLHAGLDRYLSDIAEQGYDPVLRTGRFNSAAQLRDHLGRQYRGRSGLAGAVLIGDVAYQRYEIGKESPFACDLYLQDVDGGWSDRSGNGVLDTHTGDVEPEIWLGRISAGSLVGLHPGRSEAGLINAYLAKNHHYRRGRFASGGGALAYLDDDWSSPVLGRRWTDALGRAVGAGRVELVNDPHETSADDFKARLLNEAYEHVFLAAHSTATETEFAGDSERLTSAELARLDPDALFYNLFNCSAGDFTAEGYLAGEYVLGTRKGLVALGSTTAGAMNSATAERFYAPLGDGSTFGDAWLEWWEYAARDGLDAEEADWLYGMTFTGDPLLRGLDYHIPQAGSLIPEPTTIALLLIGAAGMLFRRYRRSPVASPAG